jgi:cation transport protein ChaC
MSTRDFWVFGYGSLIWRPGFEFKEARPARIFGYHRDLCVYSFHYRGSPETPGLVAGLMPGGSCRGLAYRVAGTDRGNVIDYLDRREMIYHVYIPKWLNARTGARRIKVYTYVANPNHRQFAGDLPPERAAALIAAGRGKSGSGLEYLENTLRHLTAHGIRDSRLQRVFDLASGK